MKNSFYGNINGKEVKKHTLTNGKMEADIITYGATLTALRVNKDKKVINTVLGYDSLEDYQNGTAYYGAIIGRFGNRIQNASFVLNGKEYKVGANEGKNSLHGGFKGFDKQIWSAKPISDNCLELSYLSVDGEEGFPGNLNVTVTYSITDDNALSIEYSAVSDADTVINLTNHAYFNTNGIEDTVEGLKLQILADKITPVGKDLIPHGDFREVLGTRFDFRTPREFICDLSAEPILKDRGCFDENFVLNGSGERLVATLFSEKTGLNMEVYTDQAGLQIYTDNKYGIALETQNFPNAVNCSEYPSAILRKGEEYHTVTKYKFKL
ncbi:MAG: galactose mutarotase [Ruminococcaceae bacterium]|nr:galactose mutarotase [Oscillospiraceae bacterium]